MYDTEAIEETKKYNPFKALEEHIVYESDMEDVEDIQQVKEEIKERQRDDDEIM